MRSVGIAKSFLDECNLGDVFREFHRDNVLRCAAVKVIDGVVAPIGGRSRLVSITDGAARVAKGGGQYFGSGGRPWANALPTISASPDQLLGLSSDARSPGEYRPVTG